MSDAADHRIADLEYELMLRDQRISRYEVTSNTRLAETRSLEQRIAELEAKLVQRDVYEAEQRLPPEHAVLIKHLATVERCITEGPVTYHYAEESDCSFCGEWQGHTRDCAWFALQFERGVTSVIDDIHAVALQEHERRERQRMPREPARPGATLEQMNNIFREMYGPMVRPMTATEAAIRQQNNLAFGNTRIEVNPLVPPGNVYLTNLSDFQGIPALRQGAGLESPIAMQMRLEAEAAHTLDAPVAPPDDEDVP